MLQRLISPVPIEKDIPKGGVLMKNEGRCKEIIQNTASCIAVYEPIEDGENFVFIAFNLMAEKVEQISEKEILGKKVTDVFPHVTEFGLLEIFKNVYKTGLPEHHPISLYKDGRIVGYRENYIFKLSSGEIVASYYDRSEQKLLEEKLKQQKIHLEEMVKKRTKILEEKNRALDTALKVFVGRELKIKELQQQLDALKGTI